MNLLLAIHTIVILFSVALIYFHEKNAPLLLANSLLALISLFIALRNRKTQRTLFPVGLPILIVLVNYYFKNESFGHVGLLFIFIILCFSQTFIYSVNIIGIKSSSRNDVKVSFGLIPFFSTIYLIYICLFKAVPETSSEVYYNFAGFFLLVISFMYLLILNSYQRAIDLRFFQIFTPSILAILILLVSGSFLATNVVNDLVLVKRYAPVSNKSTAKNKSTTKKNSNNQEVGYSADMKLTGSTNLQRKRAQEIYLKLDNKADGKLLSAGNIYLKGASFDTFVNNEWSNYYDLTKLAEDGIDNLADGVIRVLEHPKDVKEIDYTVYQLNAWHGNLLGLPNILSIKIDKLFIADNETYYLHEILGNRISYHAKSAYVTYENLEDKNLKINNKHQIFRKTFGDISTRIANVGKEITFDLSSLDEKIETIKYYMRQNFRYSLITVNKDGKDPLENFFFHEKKGHCELYSTVMVMLLRGAGVPARLCVGYLGGNYNKNKDLYVFYSDQAHAWVEICVEDYNWIPLEATPSGPIGDQGLEENDTSHTIEGFHQLGPDQEKIRDARFASGLMAILQGIIVDAKKDPIVFINLVLLTYPISYFLFFGFLNLGRFKAQKYFIKTAKNLPYLSLLHKIYGKKPEHITYIEYQENLKSKGVESSIVDRMIDYYYKVCYENQDRNAKIEQEFVQELEILKKHAANSITN